MFDEVLQNMRKATEVSLKMQQEFLQQWPGNWPGMPSPQSVGVDKARDFQKQWTHTVSDLARTHRRALDQQYQALLDSLEEALRTAESSNPVEFRDRSEQLCRQTLQCMREVSEVQLREFQEAATKWSEVVSKAGR